MTSNVPYDVKVRLEHACLAGDLTTLKSILSDHPDSIHAKLEDGNIILTLKNSNHNKNCL